MEHTIYPLRRGTFVGEGFLTLTLRPDALSESVEAQTVILARPGQWTVNTGQRDDEVTSVTVGKRGSRVHIPGARIGRLHFDDAKVNAAFRRTFG